MGSRSNITEAERAYIAGFLDGDGSLMLQLKKRSDSKRGIRFMVTICFYQDTRHEAPLLWIREKFQVGYISQRNDNMTELRVNGYESVYNILCSLLPFIRFKKVQAQALIDACTVLKQNPVSKLSDRELLEIVELMMVIQNENYSSAHKKTKQEFTDMLGLTP